MERCLIKIEDYNYPLPEERIAKYPLKNRDDSKLLVNVDGTFKDEKFVNIAEYLPENSLMIFNETKVVPARLLFQRQTGAVIEIFCLEPYHPEDYQISFAQTASCRWKAIVGNVKKWKGDTLHLYTQADTSAEITSIDMKANLIERVDNTCIVEFSWDGGLSFSKVIELCGKIPVPPYLNRDTEAIDYVRYQTMYARNDGSVAAPTAGLHFTEREIGQIKAKGIETDYLCLHVGAGTFLPVKSEFIADHKMHSEPFSVSVKFLEKLLQFVNNKPVISVGTTSTRCLESLYYIGVHCIERGEPGFVDQWEPYRDEGYSYSAAEALDALIVYMKSHNLSQISSRTCLIIVPGFKYRIISYLVTNFHQPQSTLLLLVAALIGEQWKGMYQFALDNGFRFMSYGDSSLLKNFY